jgi:hypothetical protein
VKAAKLLAWHYTVCVEKLEMILQSDKLMPKGDHLEPGERDALWFSMNQFWERTATKEVTLPDGSIRPLCSMREVHEVLGIVRFGVDPTKVRLVGFDSFVRGSGISKAGASNLRIAGREVGANPYEWRVSFEPIPVELWAAIEVWTGDRWGLHSRSEATKAVRRLDDATSYALFVRRPEQLAPRKGTVGAR